MISLTAHNEIKEILKSRVKDIYVSEIIDREKQRHNKTKYSLPDANSFGWMPAINICYSIEIGGGQIMYVIPFLPYLNFMENILPRTIVAKPNLFGTGNAMDVVSALYYMSGYGTIGSIEKYQQYLIDNAYCYFILRNKKGVLENKLFRLDLFRHILLNGESSKYDFDGGLMHAFRHCSLNGRKLSSGDGETPLRDLWHLPEMIGKSILLDNQTKERNRTAVIDENRTWHIEYYVVQETKVCYLVTAFIDKKYHQ